MKKTISSSKIKGVVNAPASKSMMIRAVAASLLAPGVSVITNPSYCDDALTALGIADTLGAKTDRADRSVTIRGNGDLRQAGIKNNILDCGESGLCMRMFAPIAGLLEEEVTLTASGSLCSRPMKMVEDLACLGAQCATRGGYAPIQVKGRMGSGTIRIEGSESSQFLTGSLMALPLCRGDSLIEVSGLKSKPYVELTIDVMRKFGVTVFHDKDLTEFHIKGEQHYSPQTYTMEGDWSAAAFLLVAGALAGSVTVTGLNTDSYQADKAIMGALKQAGADVETESGHVVVRKHRLHAFEFDAGNCPDLFPPLVALGGGCAGTSLIYGAGRLKNKESNRAFALASEFSKLGIEINVFEDRMEICGGKSRAATVYSHNDHRIAMACAVAALNSEGDVVIENPECVSKSYPSFFEALNLIQVT